MHILFIHPAFPAQFGHVAAYLATQLGWRATFLTSMDTTHLELPFEHWNYRIKPGPVPKLYISDRTILEPFEHMEAVYRGLKSLSPRPAPDLVVAHTYFGSLLYLKTLFKCPFIGYFEWLPPPYWNEELVLRPEFPPTDEDRVAAAAGHVLNYRHLHLVDAIYTPTWYQHGTAPPELQYKIRVIHDGIDVGFNRRRIVGRPTQFRGVQIDANARVVTYASPGLQSWRGFDIFMHLADRICRERDDTIFLIAGEDKVSYGHEGRHIGNQTFREYVLSQGNYDLKRFHFLGFLPPEDLVTLFSLSDLHVYLTVKFILSWSMLQAMSAGCTILASRTPPVEEVIDHGVHGLLADFFDVDQLTSLALSVLRDPPAFAPLGLAARERVVERYEYRKCLDQLVQFFRETAGK